MRNLGRKLNDWRPSWQRNGLTERVLNVLRIRTSPKWSAFVSVLLVLLLIAVLSGCASAPQPRQPGTPPKELMVPPPPPGAMTDRLEAILKRGQTSEPTSTP